MVNDEFDDCVGLVMEKLCVYRHNLVVTKVCYCY